MRTITAVYTRPEDAAHATRALRELIGEEHVNLLAPIGPSDDPADVPLSEDMPPVLGPMGGILGGAVGVAVSVAIPGIGPVTGLGLAAAGILGALGGIAGYKLGDSADRVASTGLPADELYFYEDALRQNRSVVLASVPEKDDEDEVRAIMERCGAESIDAARADWTLGMRDASEETYDPDPAGEATDRREP